MGWKEFNDQIQDDSLPCYAWNASKNWQKIRNEAEKDDVCVSSIPPIPRILFGDKGSDYPALVLGSGPSLDDIMPMLRKWTGTIFCSPSQLVILNRWRINPAFIVSIDTSDIVAEQIGDQMEWTPMFITHQAVSPHSLEAWKGKKKYFRVGWDGEWGKTQAMAYPWIKATISPFGCNVNTSIQIAHRLGFSPIYLAGVDFAFTEGRSRCMGYRKRSAYQYHEVQPVVPTNQDDPRWPGRSAEQVYYHLNLLTIYKTLCPRIIAVNNKGAVQELPSISIEEFISGEIDLNTTLHMESCEGKADETLIKHGMYVYVEDNSVKIEYADYPITNPKMAWEKDGLFWKAEKIR